MFSYIPYSNPQFYPQSYGSSRSRNYAPASYYSIKLAEERAALEAAARCEREARARFGGYQDDNDDEYDGYGYIRGYTPRQRAFLEGQRRQQAAVRERERLNAEEMQRREAESRAGRAQGVRASLEDYYRNLGMRTRYSTRKVDESVSSIGLPDKNQDDLTGDVQKQDATPSPARSVPLSRSQSPLRSPSPPAQATTVKTELEPIASSSPTPEQQTDAATKIQSFYRTRKSLATISQLESNFEDLIGAFTMPETVDYLSADGEVVSLEVVPTAPLPVPSETQSKSTSLAARLAFTPANVPIRVYDEHLNRILTKLDAVESWGERKVRERRRDVVRNVELEAARIESLWVDMWRRYVGAEKDEVDVILLDEAAVDEQATKMTADVTASVEEVSSSQGVPTSSMPPEERAEDTSNSSLLATEVSTFPCLADPESTAATDVLAPLTPNFDNIRSDDILTCSEIAAASISSSDSGDSDYESVGSLSRSSEEQDQNSEEDVDYVML